MPHPTPQVTYYPPKDKHIEKFAYKIARLLDEKQQLNFTTTDNVRELSNFLKIVARIKAKQLNRSA